MPATTYFEGLVLNHALRKQPFSIENWYVGLWTSNPTVNGILTGEVSAADYQRKLVTFDSSFTNSSDILWGNATNDWGEVTYVCLCNVGNKGFGKVLIYQPRDALDINPGIQVTLPQGGLTITLL